MQDLVHDLWKLIELESKSIAVCYDFLRMHDMSPINGSRNETAPSVDAVKRVISDKRDNVKALIALQDSLTKDKPATDMTEFARKAIADYREAQKLIK